MNHRWFACLVLGAAFVLMLQGCTSGCDEETVERAVSFVDSHQTCVTDADCVVIRDYCETLPRGYCGQLSMNRAGADSAEWAALDEELRDCAPPASCSTCLAQLIPACHAGSCTRPPPL